MPASATCAPWATSADVCAETYDLDTAELDEWCQVASDILYNLTGARWPGVCTDKVRPQARFRGETVPRWWPSDGGSRYGYCSCNRGRDTGCNRVPEIRLPGSPVVPASVTVMLDGVAFTDFRIDDRRWLVRTDGDGWPCCQNLILPDTEPGTWSVLYDYNEGPPIGGVKAAAALGYELFQACSPDEEVVGRCRLPKRTVSLVRQGETAQMFDPSTVIEKGMVGITEVDIWVMSIIQGAKRRGGRVLIPGRPRGVRRTG